ncbi:hypothetical protein HOD84_02525 [bacterium]|jgi:hypothetical protein|nr:hypothetical protein [bacterium]
MNNNSYNVVGRDRIKEILDEGWSQIEFIEVVFREWSKLNQIALNNEYFLQNKIQRDEDDLDKFSLWLVDNIFLQVYCKTSDNNTVKEFCSKYFSTEGGFVSET